MVLSAAGRHDAAVALAREAVEMFLEAEDPNSQGDLRMDLAEVLRAAGKRVEAERAAREALRSYDAKGNALAATSAKSFLASLST
jgi:tetratricopeptide (TPR) repeat protein